VNRFLLAVLLAAPFVSTAVAQPAHLSPALAGLSFLVGDWSSTDGKVADTGGTSSGSSHITVAAGGAALVRQDHTDLRDAHGKPSAGFDQIMLIYAEAGAIHAEYTDGTHVIHYRTTSVTPGRAVTFVSDQAQGGPIYRLNYDLAKSGLLSVNFQVAPPGGIYRLIAAGTLHSAR
jgi:hypothetical protein